MGKEKYVNEVMGFLQKSPVASARDIRMVVNRLKLKKSYPDLLVHNLVKSGRMTRVTKGFYTTHEDPTVAVFCFRPAYIGLQDALSIQGLWEQETNVVLVTTKRARIGLRKVMGENLVLHRIDSKYFFGFDYITYDNKFAVPVSDLEKTLIDFVYFKEPLDDNVVKEMKKKINKLKLNNYLKKYPKNLETRVNKILDSHLRTVIETRIKRKIAAQLMDKIRNKTKAGAFDSVKSIREDRDA